MLFESVFATALFLIICVIHILSAIANGRIVKILKYVNIGLHILLVFPLIWLGVQMDEALLIYMISALIYIVFALIEYKINEAKK